MVINLLKSNHSNPQAKLEVLQRRVRLLQSLEELRQTQLQDCFANIEVMNGYPPSESGLFFGSSMTFAYILQFYSTSKCESSTSGCLQDLYGLLDKPADVVWQDDRCKRKQPKQSQSPASVRSFLAKKWLFKNGDVLDQTFFTFSDRAFSCIPINEVQKKKKRNMAKT